MAVESPGKSGEQQSSGAAAVDEDHDDPRLAYTSAEAAEAAGAAEEGAEDDAGAGEAAVPAQAAGRVEEPDGGDAEDSGGSDDGGEDAGAAAGEADGQTADGAAQQDDEAEAEGDDDGEEPQAEAADDATGGEPAAETAAETAAEDGPGADGPQAETGADGSGEDGASDGEPVAEASEDVAEDGPGAGTAADESAEDGAADDEPRAEAADVAEDEPRADGPEAAAAADEAGAHDEPEDARPADSSTAIFRSLAAAGAAKANEDERLRAAVAEWVTRAGTDDEAADTDADSDADAEAAETGPGGGDDAAPEPGETAQATDVEEPPAPAAAERPAEDAGEEPVEETAPEDAGPAAGGAAAKGVDQPTTTLRSPADGTKPAGPAEPPPMPAKPPAKPDRPGESTFVPLKPDSDIPAAHRAAAAPETDAPEAPDTPDTPAAPQVPPRPTAPPEVGVVPPKPAEPPSAEPSHSEVPGWEQTKQQPLPPYEEKRPLDLLAELTNTPPPPETLARIVVRRIKIYTPLAILLVIILGVVQMLRPLPAPALELTAESSYAFEGGSPQMPWPDEGQAAVDVVGLGSLGSHGKQKPVPIASVTKVMTAYIILRDRPIRKGTEGASIPVDDTAVKEAGLSSEGETTVELDKNSKISEKEALQALLIASANNVARLLARWHSDGDTQAFVDEMNSTAEELGMENTTFTDPSGLEHSTVSTAEDLVKLGKAAMRDPLFKEIVGMSGYTDSRGDAHDNSNKMVPVYGIGIKVGSTTKAGGNFLFATEKEVAGEKQLIVGAVLGQYAVPQLPTAMERGRQLMDAAERALTEKTVVKKGEVVGEVDDGLGGTTPLVATEKVVAPGWGGLKGTLEIGPRKGEDVPHEAGKGDEIGELIIGSGQGEVRVPVALAEDLAEPGMGAKLTRLG